MIQSVFFIFSFPNVLILDFKNPENFDQLHIHPNKT